MSITRRKTLRIVLYGDNEVGKTTMVSTAMSRSIPSGYVPTIGVDHGVYKCVTNDFYMTLRMWDLSGNSRFDYLWKTFVSEAHVFIFCFDLHRNKTFKSLQKYIEFVHKHHGGDYMKFIVGINKNLEYLISDVDIQNFAIKNDAKYFQINPMQESDVIFLLHSISNYAFDLASETEQMKQHSSSTLQTDNSCPCM